MPEDDPPEPPPRASLSGEVLGQFSWGLVIVFTLATACWGVLPFTGPYFPAIIFLMAIAIVGAHWHRGPVILMAAVSALVWNFIFIPPRFTLHIADPQNGVTFALFFVIAVSMGHLTHRLHAREQELQRHLDERQKLVAGKLDAELVAESSRLHRTLLDSVSHEFKTPIAVIRTAVDGLDPENRYAQEIDTATRRLQRLVDNLVEMTRIDSASLTPNPDWCEPTDIIEAASAPLARELKDHRLHVTTDPSMPLVLVDSRLISQALGLILHNATVHGPAGQPIDVHIAYDSGRLTIKVRDRGPGIAPWAVSRVFEKFYRAPGAPAGGTGLGLTIARGLMVAMGGDIAAANHPEGGAEFILSLPTKSRPLATAP